MHPDLDAIAAADAAARRDVEAVTERLAARETAERERLHQARDAAAAAALARLDADIRAVESEARARIAARTAARTAARDRRRARATAATADAVRAYVTIVRGDEPPGGRS